MNQTVNEPGSETWRSRLRVLNREWKDCTRCPLGAKARNHVLYQLMCVPENHVGSVDLMFVGEGPGAAENVLGEPFIGPSGRLLRRAVQEARLGAMSRVFTNLLSCRATDNGQKDRSPRPEEVQACAPRLAELIEIWQPRIVVALGREAQCYLPELQSQWLHGDFCEVVPALHPAAVLRMGGERSSVWERYVQVLRKAGELAAGRRGQDNGC
jgi:uracil-DNA glycosylase family 4